LLRILTGRALANHPRNPTDDQIKAIIDNDGVIGMITCNALVDDEAENWDLEHYLNHVDHIVELGGIPISKFGFCERSYQR